MKTLSRPEDLQALRQRLLSLCAEDERQWGKMTAADMLVHLRQSFRAIMAEIDIVTPPMPKPAPLPGPVLKWIALRLPLRWPTTIKTPPPFEVGSSWMDLAAFDQDRESAIAAMERFALGQWTVSRHPMFGRISFGDWVRWGWLHVDHHLRQFGR